MNKHLGFIFIEHILSEHLLVQDAIDKTGVSVHCTEDFTKRRAGSAAIVQLVPQIAASLTPCVAFHEPA